MCSTSSETDFVIRCLPEDVTFKVQKVKLIEGSEVLAGMFSCCIDSDPKTDHHSVDIYESSDNIAMLVRLLHDPPAAFSKGRYIASSSANRSASLPIPYLLLPQIFALADKYALKPVITSALATHLAAQASIAPLLVYGLAMQYSLSDVADRASKFLISKPLETYSTEEIKIIPTAEAYHRLLQLQAHRKVKIKELLLKEELFPHGYGTCNSHKDFAEAAWNQKRKRLLESIESGTDVGGRMSRGVDAKIRQCKVCRKAWIAATDMLSHKCKKSARRISQLPSENS